MVELLDKPNSKSYLELSSDPVKFEPVSKVTNVFFDESNKEVLSVRGGGTLGVVVKAYGRTLTYCMDYKETISSIKFSPDHSVLAIQRTCSAVELLSVRDGKLNHLHSQESRAKGANVLGFIWSNQSDLVLVNDHAIEFYQVIKEKSNVRFIKSYSQNNKWFVWSPQCLILLLCTSLGITTASFQPYTFSQGQITKLTKFEVEMSGSAGQLQGNSVSVNLTERDVCVASLYDSPAVLILRHPMSSTLPAYLDVYSQGKDLTFKKSHVCLLELTGKFAVNIIDSLIVVHHQASQTSLIFDIKSGMRMSPGFVSVYPLTLPRSIQAFDLEEQEAMPSSASLPRSFPCQLYAPTWVVFQPNIIIDARLGYMWELHLCLESLTTHVEDKTKLIECLLRRKNAKPLVLSVVKDEIESCNVGTLAIIFDQINANYRHHLNSVLQSQIGDCMNVLGPLEKSDVTPGCVIIDQAEIYSSVFAPIMENISRREKKESETEEKQKLNYELMVGIVLDYIRSLNKAGISVPYFINELVINGLVTTRQFYQLHQLLQYHVLPDSKPLACILLSLVGVYEAAEQLSLDMLSRLNTAHDEIIEVLLSHNLVVQALKYSKSIGQDESISSRKFLEVAMTTNDPLVFYSTFKFFTQRNSSLRGKPSFAKGEHCEDYVKHYQKLFGDSDNQNSYLEP